MQKQSVWIKFLTWLFHRATSVPSSQSNISPAPVSNPPYTVSFPYAYDESGTPAATPILDVLDANNDFQPYTFELDSGAYISVLPASAGLALGVPINQGTPLVLSGISGNIQTYVHQLSVRFHGSATVFPLEVAIASVECPILLGRYGFWNSLHSILLNMGQKQVSFS